MSVNAGRDINYQSGSNNKQSIDNRGGSDSSWKRIWTGVVVGLLVAIILGLWSWHSTSLRSNFISIPEKSTPSPSPSSTQSIYPLDAYACKEDSECAIFTCECGTSLRKDYKGPPPAPPKSVCTVVCYTTPKCISNKCKAVPIK